jgi:protein-L-isoaspartate(D-aspartate) O-methyltransferase
VIDYSDKRRRMVREQIEARGVRDPAVLKAMEKVPRHLFIPEAMLDQAYEDSPLPIGSKQTISPPYTVAFMTEALELAGNEKVLEIGTGSGYQTAILAELSKEVYSLERIPELAELASKRLAELGYKNVRVRTADGTLGWPEAGPFPAIIVTAGAPEIPEPLLEQLEDRGRLVIPVGDKHSQTMIRVRKRGRETVRESLGPFRFVELIGEHGHRE